MAIFIPKGFTHVRRLAGIEEGKCNELRSTCESRHRADYGAAGLISLVSDHRTQSVVDNRYTATIEAAMVRVKFRVFKEDEQGVNQGFHRIYSYPGKRRSKKVRQLSDFLSSGEYSNI